MPFANANTIQTSEHSSLKDFIALLTFIYFGLRPYLNLVTMFRFDSHFDPEKHNVWVRRYWLAPYKYGMCLWMYLVNRYALAEEKREQSRIDEWKRIQDMRRRRSCAHLVPFSWKLCILESIIVGKCHPRDLSHHCHIIGCFRNYAGCCSCRSYICGNYIPGANIEEHISFNALSNLQ